MKQQAVKIQTRRKPTAFVLQRKEIRQKSDFGIIMVYLKRLVPQ
jgi:hypothetical protein